MFKYLSAVRDPLRRTGPNLRKDPLPAISNRRLLLAFMVICLAGFTVLSARADAARSFNTGIIDGTAFEEGSDAAFDHAAASGAKYLKNNLYWHEIAANRDSAERPGTLLQPFDARDPASPYYSWGPFDRLVREAKARGMEPVLSIVRTPRWARGTCTNSPVCSPKPSDYADFATAAAKRYSGTFDPGDGEGVLPRVRFWQAWVEPNLYLFYAPIYKSNGTPSAPYTFRVILNAFYDAIHAVNNSNTVIAGGLAPNAVPGRAIAPLDFTRRALCMTGNYKNPRPKPGCNFRVKADAWSVHPYTTGAPTHFPTKPDNMSVAALPRLTKLLKAANRANRLTGRGGKTQLWVTEFSWDSKPPDPGGLPWNLQARWVAQAMYMMYKAEVATMVWFGLRDQARSPGQKWSETFESGLYLRGNTVAQDKPKKVLKVFRYPFYAQLAGKQGFSFWGRTPTSKTATIDLFGRRKGSGGYARVGTAKANANGIFTGLVRKRGFTARGAVYAKIRGGQASVPFGLWKTKDFYQPPFG